MAKTKLEIRSMSCQHCVKTVTDALTALEGVQHVKVNLRKGEAVVRYDASYITDANLVEAITAVGFEAVTKTKPLSLRLIGGILITFLSITGCSDMPYTGSMLTTEDVDRYITIGENSACLLSGDELACITLIPETGDDSRPIIHIYPNKLIYVFYYEGVPIIQAEIVIDTTEIMEQVRGQGEDDQPPSGDGGVRDDSPDDDGDGTIDGGGDTQQPSDGGTPRSDGGTQKPDGGTQQRGDGSTPRSDGGNNGQGNNGNGNGNNGNGNNGQGNNGNGNGNNGNGNNGQGNGNNGNGNNGQGNNGQGNGNNGNGNNGNNGNGNGNGNNGNGNNAARNNVVGDSDITSHYYYTDKGPPITGNGWLIHIYYPSGYSVPPKFGEGDQPTGFTLTVSAGKITGYAETAIECHDYDNDGQDDRPCTDGSVYSAQLFIETTMTTITITVTWDSPYSRLNNTYTLNAAVNIARNHPDHTSQRDN